MAEYKAICSDCPKCRKENVIALTYSFRKSGVTDSTVRKIACCHCAHEYSQQIQDMLLREKDKAEVEALGGPRVFEYL